MKIYRPIKTNWITQVFGENKPCVQIGADGKATTPFVIKNFPNDICPVGYKKFYPEIGMKGHNGIDMASYYGESVYFNVEENVEWEASTEIDRDGGIGVNVRSKQPIALASLPKEMIGSMNLAQRQYDKLDGKVYLFFRYWHLKGVNVYDKQPVKLGQVIGWTDSTGASSGNHLHFGAKVSDETSWFTLDGDNGYTGAFDPMPWYENKFVLDAEENNNGNIQELQLTVIQLANKAIYLLKQLIAAKKGRIIN